MANRKNDHTAVGMYKEDGIWFLVVDSTIVPMTVLFELELQVCKEANESPFQSTMKTLMEKAVEEELLDILKQVAKQTENREKNNTDKGLN
jgi:hypothetical protein